MTRQLQVGDLWFRKPYWNIGLNALFHLGGGSKDICLTISYPHVFTTLNGSFLQGKLTPEEWL